MAEPSKEQSDASASGNAKAAPAAKSANAGQSGVQAAAPQAGAKAKASSQDAIALLTKDHREVDELFKQFEGATSRARKQALVEQACRALELHTQLEEQIFYPACREAAADDDPLDEAQVEHDTVKLLIADLRAASAGAPYYDAKVKVLSEYVRHHVGEEEGADGIFARARKDGVDLDQLGERIRSEKERLGRQAEGQSQSLTLVALRTGMGRSENQDYPKERTMARAEYGRSDYRDDDRGRGGNRGNDRDRDEYGRFTSDDDRSGGRSSRGRDDDDDRSGRDRDRNGRFTSDDRGGSRSGRNGSSTRGYDDDRGRSSSRGRDDDGERDGGRRGGWFGDSEGHSEAARRGWDHDRRGESGWFGDSDGHSEASRRGWDHDRRGESGWFGDSEGHSEAARRGWDDRGGSRGSQGRRDDDDRGYSSRGRSDDDDRRRSSSSRDRDDDRGSRSSRGGRSRDDDDRGHGGWFGDSRGHSEAARRGRESRH
ncbi:hemerythrin domain-containing protein [Novosphingobium sp.]|uniref:hemerythrin domain-containing protein n=1 Tax=Novosphingobium sp. TaxID=1874826 RepID=UPI0038BE0436